MPPPASCCLISLDHIPLLLLHHGSASIPNLAPDKLHIYVHMYITYVYGTPPIFSLSKLFKLFTLSLGQTLGILVYLHFSNVDFEKFAIMTSGVKGEEKKTHCLQMKGSIWNL